MWAVGGVTWPSWSLANIYGRILRSNFTMKIKAVFINEIIVVKGNND